MWAHFDISPTDQSNAICKHCRASVSHGGKTSVTWSTTTLRNHLIRHHPSIKLTEPTKEPTPSSSSSTQQTSSSASQPSVFAAFERGRPWEFNDPRSLNIHRVIAQMVAVDDQPFSIVSNDGFRALIGALEPRYKLPSESYLRQTAIPELYRSLKAEVATKVAKVKFISLTTDTWTTSMCSESLMSLTGHWLDDGFTRQSAILQTSHLPGSHTAANIKDKFSEMVNTWKLEGKVCIKHT